MLSLNNAIEVVKANIPNCVIKKVVVHKDMYVFLVFTSDKVEGMFDPFYSVNMNTSEFSGFAMMNPEVFDVVMGLFDTTKDLTK